MCISRAAGLPLFRKQAGKTRATNVVAMLGQPWHNIGSMSCVCWEGVDVFHGRSLDLRATIGRDMALSTNSSLEI